MSTRPAKNTARKAAAGTAASTASASLQAFPGVPAGVLAELVPTQSLGSVVVRGSLLSELLTDELLQARDGKPREGESEDQARVRVTVDKAIRTLARQVLDEAGQPLKTAAEWDAYGARHRIDSLALFNVAERLSGSTETAQKNS